jgi:hypothetical protein
MHDRVTPRGSQDTWVPIRFFDDAVCEFAVEYADQNQRDYRTFIKAVREGRIKVITEA